MNVKRIKLTVNSCILFLKVYECKKDILNNIKRLKIEDF